MTSWKPLMVFSFAVMVMVGGFYGLVIYPYVLDDLVKGAIISLMTLAAKAVFDEQQAERAFNSALQQQPPEEVDPIP